MPQVVDNKDERIRSHGMSLVSTLSMSHSAVLCRLFRFGAGPS
jgi:hypothetical protein